MAREPRQNFGVRRCRVLHPHTFFNHRVKPMFKSAGVRYAYKPYEEREDRKHHQWNGHALWRFARLERAVMPVPIIVTA